MKHSILVMILFVSAFVYGQKEIIFEYKKADSLFQNENYKEAFKILKEIEPLCDVKDTLYNYILWYYAGAATQLEKQYRMNEQFEISLKYGLETLELIKKGKNFFDEKFASREFWMYKNVIVSYFGLGQPDNAKKYKDLLYKAYKENRLPDGINEYFNFDYFRWDNKNIWGYEWYEELPENRSSKSFSKIVYYVYSTNPYGTDKDQLYRLHVLMFHKFDNSVSFDYVLTKRLETVKNEVSGTLYAYTYNKNIDYVKLHSDIKEVLKGNYKPINEK